ncbi:MAG TPA: cysteine desulfurase [Prolixibacteraceae bacterium]|nr:cysteine desulfurase [Prolixibacteraceae bacterium]
MIPDISKMRKDFPILDQKVNGKPLIYFDNAATSQRPIQVIERVDEFSLRTNANIHRATHYLANKTTEAFEASRETVRQFINAGEASEVIFTQGTTESINLVAFSFGEAFVSAGDEVIVTEMEHHANIVPWQMMCERRSAILKVLPFNDNGELQIELLDSLITNKTRILAVAHVSNTLGTINPIREIILKAHLKNVPVLIDGAQAAAHFKIDVQELGCDFYAFSGHKIYGPTGIGALYGKRKWLDQMPPFMGGGEMIDRVTFAKTTYNQLPYKFEAGTPNYVGAIGFAAAIQYIQTQDNQALHAYEHDLLTVATEKLQQIEGLKIYGEATSKAAVICFNIVGIHPFDLGTLLDQMGIAVRTGRLCADPVMDHYGVENMVRASFAFYNTFEEINAFYKALIRLKAMF